MNRNTRQLLKKINRVDKSLVHQEQVTEMNININENKKKH